MTRRCRPTVVFLTLCASLALHRAAAADSVFDNYDSGGTFSPANNFDAASAFRPPAQTATLRAAARFTVTGGNFTLDAIRLPISQQNSIAGNYLRVRLTADAGGVPGTTLEVLSDGQPWPAFGNPFSTSTALASITHPLLTNGASYWIVTELNQFPALVSGQGVDYRWFRNVSGAAVPFRQQQMTGGLPVDPWGGTSSPQNPAFRVDGTPVCSLESGPLSTSSHFWDAPDALADVYWRIPRESCVACSGAGGLTIDSVSFRLRWFGACTAHADVSIVGAMGGACEVPDTTRVLCSPVTYAIVATEQQGATYTLAPANGCIGGDAFLRIHFRDLGPCAGGAASVAYYLSTSACSACQGFFATIGQPAIEDWCTLPVAQQLWAHVESHCCTPLSAGDRPPANATTLAVLGAPSSAARIAFTLAGSARRRVELEVFDLFGRRIQRLVDGELEPGSHVVPWDGSAFTGMARPGVYEARLRTPDAVLAAKLILLR